MAELARFPATPPTPLARTAVQGGVVPSCCTAFYELDWVRHLAHACFHPGGEDLTRRTVLTMGLRDGALMTDIGCGLGTSASLLAREQGLNVYAVDLGSGNLAFAKRNQSQQKRTGPAVRYLAGDAVKLPFADRSLDAVLAECSVSLVSNQATALAEFHRVLKPGGQLGITDMAVAGELSSDLAAIVAPWTCLAQAQSRTQYNNLFEDAGFSVRKYSDETAGLLKMCADLKRKLLLLATGAALGNVEIPSLDLAGIRFWMSRFKEEVERGRISYLRFNLQS